MLIFRMPAITAISIHVWTVNCKYIAVIILITMTQ